MQAIIDFFVGIGDAIVSGIAYFIHTIMDLVYVVDVLGIFLHNLPYYFSWLPVRFLAIILLVFDLAVLYKILGREG